MSTVADPDEAQVSEVQVRRLAAEIGPGRHVEVDLGIRTCRGDGLCERVVEVAVDRGDPRLDRVTGCLRRVINGSRLEVQEDDL